MATTEPSEVQSSTTPHPEKTGEGAGGEHAPSTPDRKPGPMGAPSPTQPAPGALPPQTIEVAPSARRSYDPRPFLRRHSTVILRTLGILGIIGLLLLLWQGTAYG